MIDNPFAMVVAIVLIVSVAGVLRAKYGVLRDKHGNERPMRDPDADRMRDELKALRERVAVLERIATDDSAKLDREIEALRDKL